MSAPEDATPPASHAEAARAYSTYRKLRHARWPWRPADEVCDPELNYWLTRAEVTIQTRDLSTQYVRAIKREIAALQRVTSRSQHAAALIAALGITVLIGAWFALAAGLAPFISAEILPADPVVGPYPVSELLATAITVALSIGWWILHVRPSITDRFAHRAVVARDRLNRWLSEESVGQIPPANESAEDRHTLDESSR
ncbi:hypothetical protein KL864_25540 [Mycolicibacterium goodii]|uniref:hypothetical protein n=1 Tax=Mycolicibacterium goodii TaxID=134601 RepID=UPI001BDCED67|nr:hypothetical protein [Mycolicibacterium goodii]MBU8819262.1 hypothetical protein [Mycolicibacterium goodii]